MHTYIFFVLPWLPVCEEYDNLSVSLFIFILIFFFLTQYLSSSLGSYYTNYLLNLIMYLFHVTNKYVFFTKFQNRIPFVDDEFPPSPRSLFYNTEDPSNHQVSHWINQAPVTYLEFVSTPKEEKLI